ncbi:MAG: PaaI family thioesterase [Rhodanobacteraceae bacterium]
MNYGDAIERFHTRRTGALPPGMGMSGFEPGDAGYAERVRASFARQQVMRTLGVTVADVQPGEIRLALPYAATLTQHNGYLHAGVLSTALDSACGYAAYSLMPADADVLTIEFKVNFLRPARGEVFAFHGWVVKPGRTISVCEAEVHASSPTPGPTIATMTATMIAVFNRER